MVDLARIETYGDALFSAKRGFLILGLTGYTGAGCTTAARILAKDKKIEFPIELPPDHNEIIEKYGDRRFKKLKDAWNNIEWSPFVKIEVAVVIYSLLARQALTSNYKKGIMNDIKNDCKNYKEELIGLSHLINNKALSEKESYEVVSAYELCEKLLIKFKAKTKLNEFIYSMQNAGDSIRLFGRYEINNRKIPDPKNMFVIPEAIRKIIKSYYKISSKTRFVIDSFRNPFEVEYFKRRYTECYVISMFRDKESRIKSLNSFLNRKEMEKIWEKEDGKNPTFGKLKRDFPKSPKNIGWWVTGQNIPECGQKADIFINNSTFKDFTSIKYYLAKFLTLMHMPGCVPPTSDEYGMQIASTARQMSGCVSRQVGAAVVGQPHGYVLGIGWNDPPAGQVPCALRSCGELLDTIPREKNDPYSEFERSDKFREHIENTKDRRSTFCFRTELANIEKEKKMEYTRALHAEENAFLQTAKVGGVSLVGSVLYTTSSTCTLCAKKAYQLGVERIVFIERYPDLAYEQTIHIGEADISYEQFQGITGAAFYALYAPLMPEKDLVDYYK